VKSRLRPTRLPVVFSPDEWRIGFLNGIGIGVVVGFALALGLLR
jgi:hypothetical protein